MKLKIKAKPVPAVAGPRDYSSMDISDLDDSTVYCIRSHFSKGFGQVNTLASGAEIKLHSASVFDYQALKCFRTLSPPDGYDLVRVPDRSECIAVKFWFGDYTSPLALPKAQPVRLRKFVKKPVKKLRLRFN